MIYIPYISLAGIDLYLAKHTTEPEPTLTSIQAAMVAYDYREFNLLHTERQRKVVALAQDIESSIYRLENE
jgi:hypothetical protein